MQDVPSQHDESNVAGSLGVALLIRSARSGVSFLGFARRRHCSATVPVLRNTACLLQVSAKHRVYDRFMEVSGSPGASLLGLWRSRRRQPRYFYCNSLTVLVQFRIRAKLNWPVPTVEACCQLPWLGEVATLIQTASLTVLLPKEIDLIRLMLSTLV